MKVFTYYDPDLEKEPVGAIIRLWELSWRAHGWTPQLLVPRLARAHYKFEKTMDYWQQFELAYKINNEPGSMVEFRVLNNGWVCGTGPLEVPVATFPELAPLVKFTPEHTIQDMLTLGPYAL